MRNYLLWTATLLLLLLAACKKDEIRINEQGEIVGLEPLWKTAIQRGDRPYSNSIIRAHLAYGRKVLLATVEGESDHWLTAVDVDTGEDLWKWNEVYEPWEKFDITYAYSHQNLMTYVRGGRHYCIDLETGQTHWRIRREDSYRSEIFGLRDSYFITGPNIDSLPGYRTNIVYRGNLYSGELETYLYPPDIDFTTGGEADLVTGFNRVLPVERNGKQYLILDGSDPFPNWYYDRFLGLYNATDQVWEYNRINIAEPKQNNTIRNLIVYEEKVYTNAGNEIACHDLWTGEQRWKRKFPLDFLFSGFIVADGRVVANCENSVLYGLDADRGTTLWEGEGAGTSSFLEGRYLNGIVYFSGGSTGRIHAVDTETGKTVWRLEPGRIEKGAEDWKPDIYVIPGQGGEKGRVVACTPLHAYCFEAYR